MGQTRHLRRHRSGARGRARGGKRTLEREAPGVASAILEGLNEILTVVRLGLLKELRRSLACISIIENIMGLVRRVRRNVKRWCDTSMALRWTATAMLMADKTSQVKGQEPTAGATRRPPGASSESHRRCDCPAGTRRVLPTDGTLLPNINVERNIPLLMSRD